MKGRQLVGIVSLLLLVGCGTKEGLDSLEGNRIRNGDFSRAEEAWSFAYQTSKDIVHEKTYEGERFCVSVDKGGDLPWDIGFYQEDLKLKAGEEYTLSFTVTTETEGGSSFYVRLAEGQEPYAEYVYSKESVSGSQAETKTTTFLMPTSDESVRLEFQ
ncbi:MAG: carbohydrate binding domain-containing protein, partial [Trueperaceae bacterium]